MRFISRLRNLIRIPRWIVYCALAAIAVILLPWGFILWQTRDSVFILDADVPTAPIAIVFGAGLTRQGLPTPYLYDRVLTGVDLYERGKVQKLLMSGDNRSEGYNEPEAMKKLAVSLGVPAEDIILDYAGLRTYDTCYRARFVFGIQRALLVSQGYHIPRAVYTCSQLGVDAKAVSADRRRYFVGSWMGYLAREIAACDAAIADIYLLKPQPILGPLEKV